MIKQNGYSLSLAWCLVPSMDRVKNWIEFLKKKGGKKRFSSRYSHFVCVGGVGGWVVRAGWW